MTKLAAAVIFAHCRYRPRPTVVQYTVAVRFSFCQLPNCFI